MPRKKEKQTFFKIKEKLVFVPPKKFFKRKLMGIVCLFCGSLIIAVSLAYFYVIPRFFPTTRSSTIEIIEKETAFVPERILFPYLGLDFSVEEDIVKTEPPLKNFVVERGEEIFVLSGDSYKSFQVILVTTENSSSSSTLKIDDQGLQLILQTKVKPPKTLIIRALPL